MRAVVQRVSSASVSVEQKTIGHIRFGLLIFLGIQKDDTEVEGAWLAQKIVALRIFEDEAGKMNRSILETGDDRDRSRADPTILVVSQFTLLANTRKGTRPSFNDAAPPDIANPLYEAFVTHLSALLDRPVATGKFGAFMKVTLVNDGPVTLILDTRLRE